MKKKLNNLISWKKNFVWQFIQKEEQLGKAFLLQSS